MGIAESGIAESGIAESRIVDTNPVVQALGRRLRLAVIGGGPGSFIGEMHRAASRLDDRYRIVAAALSSDAERGRAAARRIGVPDDRAYGSAAELIDREAARDDGADVVAIMTPNETHRVYSVAALERGFDVICDKPLANSLDDALAVVRAVRACRRVFALTHNYTGYPMVRQARAMVAAGELGAIRLVQVEYVQGGNAVESDPPTRWRFDPARSGPSLILGDIGTHAHHLVCYVAGVELKAVATDVGAIVPGRKVHDYAGVLLRFENGARGCLWATQAAAGMESSLGFRISGTAGHRRVAPGPRQRAPLPAARRPGAGADPQRTGDSAAVRPRQPCRQRATRRGSTKLSPTSTRTPPR